jgi:hypothetical protein
MPSPNTATQAGHSHRLRSEKPLSDPYGLTKRMANELEATTTAITKSVRTVMVLVMGLVRATRACRPVPPTAPCGVPERVDQQHPTNHKGPVSIWRSAPRYSCP